MPERRRRFLAPFSIRAVLFDLDGTLIDTAPDLATAVNLALGALGFPGIELALVRTFTGNGVRELMRRSRLYPTVTDTLESLRTRGLALGCVTNKVEVFTAPLLDAFGLSRYFSVVLSGDSLPRKKPDPLPFVHAGRTLLEAASEQVLVVGDLSNDVAAARAAGMPVVCVSYGYRREASVCDLGADAAIDALSELPGLLAAEIRA